MLMGRLVASMNFLRNTNGSAISRIGATEVPAPLILHFESPSPLTPLGAKGVGEGNCMSTPVCIANAVADALGVAEIDLPLTPAKLAALMRREAP